MRALVNVQRDSGLTVEAEVSVAPGETLALVGPNGAGKSTTLLALAGLVEGGATFLEGQDLRVGLVFQDGLLFPHLSVRDNVAFGATGDVDAVMSDFDVAHLASQKPSTLSGGEAQRVAIARTMASEPEVLLLDEPMSALDAPSRTEMRRYLATKFGDFSGAIVLVAHDPLDALGLADRVMVMERGRVIQEGTPAELRISPASPFVADLVGTNLLSGTIDGGTVDLGGHRLTVVTTFPDGTNANVQIEPHAISVHPDRPTGSARNVWAATVEGVEMLGQVARVSFGAPIPLTAEITADAASQLSIAPGTQLYLAIKATEIVVRRG